MKPLALALALCATAHAEAPFHDSNQSAAPLFPLVLDGRLEEALQNARQALARSIEESGESHPITASHRRNLALVLWHLGELKEAKAELSLAVGRLGPPDQAAASRELETLDSDIGGKARKPAAGEGSFEWLLEKSRLALAKGKAMEGLEWAVKAESLGKSNFGAVDHPFLAPAWEQMASCQEALGNHGAKAGLLEQAVTGRDRSGGLLHYSSLAQHEARARDLARLGRKKEAAELFGKILDLRKKIQSPQHPALAILEAEIRKLR